MANESTCFKCGKALESDAIPIYKKLINRAAEDFMCIDCLAEYVQMPREAIERLIDYYTESGICALF